MKKLYIYYECDLSYFDEATIKDLEVTILNTAETMFGEDLDLLHSFFELSHMPEDVKNTKAFVSSEILLGMAYSDYVISAGTSLLKINRQNMFYVQPYDVNNNQCKYYYLDISPIVERIAEQHGYDVEALREKI